jgi:hypothetical protein
MDSRVFSLRVRVWKSYMGYKKKELVKAELTLAREKIDREAREAKGQTDKHKERKQEG